MRLKRFVLLIAMALCYLIVSMPVLLAQELNLFYDKNGNLVSGDGYFREYNGFNQLVRIRNSSQTGQVMEEFVWSPLEERILIKDVFYKGVKNYTVYYVTPEYVVTENKTGNYTEKFVYQDSQLVAQINTNGQKQFLHNDHEGSSTLISDLSGNVVENSFYSAFGEIISGGASSRYDYTGKEFDSLTQDYDYGARKYKADWGKFIHGDPVIKDVYNPKDLNHYSYARNNPLKYIDPNGKEVVVAVRHTDLPVLGDVGHISLVVKDPDKGNYRYYSDEGPRSTTSDRSPLYEAKATFTNSYKSAYSKGEGDSIDAALPDEYYDTFTIQTTAEQERQIINEAESIIANPEDYNTIFRNSQEFVVEALETGSINLDQKLTPEATFNENKEIFNSRTHTIQEITVMERKLTPGASRAKGNVRQTNEGKYVCKQCNDKGFRVKPPAPPKKRT